MKNILLCSLATRGYHWLYRQNLDSHRAYAKRFGYLYSVVERPLFTTAGLDVAWMKVFMLRAALQSGYDWVMFVDADAAISARCPPFETLEQPGKSIYLAQGFSGRVNSGVMILKNNRYSQAFIEQTITHKGMKLPAWADVGWGENGHIIYFSQNNSQVAIVDQRWNNNADHEMADFIRHYSAGPLRSLYRPNPIDALRFRGLGVLLSLATRFQSLTKVTTASSSKFSCLSSYVKNHFNLIALKP